MTEIYREYLIIPNGGELHIAFDSMKGRVRRAVERGERPEDFGTIGYPNANRILANNPALAEHLQKLSRSMASGVAETLGIGIDGVFMAGVKDVLEILAVATTYDQVTEIGEAEV
jgi:hypothetical protein